MDTWVVLQKLTYGIKGSRSGPVVMPFVWPGSAPFTAGLSSPYCIIEPL